MIFYPSPSTKLVDSQSGAACQKHQTHVGSSVNLRYTFPLLAVSLLAITWVSQSVLRTSEKSAHCVCSHIKRRGLLRQIPVLEDYGLSAKFGFLPQEAPLGLLPDLCYNAWEDIVANLPALIRDRGLRRAIDRLPTLDTSGLKDEAEWRRAYCLLCFMMQGYVWNGDSPMDRVPPQVAIPLLAVSEHLEILPVATYAAVCLWNFRPVFHENVGKLEQLTSLHTFTGLTDESWFYAISVAIELQGAPILALGLRAIAAARRNDSVLITSCLRACAERLIDLTRLLHRMQEGCNPGTFYHQIRPYLAGSKNMAEAGLPHGVIYDDGSGADQYRQYSGGSNCNFIHDMRQYMPARHAAFLRDVGAVANVRQYVENNTDDEGLCFAYNACLAELAALRDKHIVIAARYIINPSPKAQKLHSGDVDWRKGTGGTALVPSLQQVRDETKKQQIASRKNSVQSDKLSTDGPCEMAVSGALNRD
ncbi:indoleamine 2,3-dioxygenase [Cordyceps javanica]|nr:indoleamine 2,3-dioxygenase [Cordyceps javanica]